VIFHNLLAAGFVGPVYPVNHRAEAVQSVRAYASVLDVPGPVDLAVVVIPKRHVRGIVEQCSAKGVRGIVVISAGYKETGPDGAEEEDRLRELVREKGIRVVGPNCLGVLSTDENIRLNATFAPTYPPEGHVAIASQSGALGLVILDNAREFNIGVSEFVSTGNKADVSGNDLIQWWDQDDRTKVILLYLESFGNPRTFVRLARDIGRRKPIVAVKSGRSKRGSKAASSHTGALAGAEGAVGALVAQTGLIRVDTVEELFDMAAFLAHQPVPAGNRVAILTNAGGPGILATDACEAWGLEVPDLSPATTSRLREFLPPEASVRNPVDMIAGATPEDYERAIQLLLEDLTVDALIVIFVPPIVIDARAVGKAIVSGAQGADKPVLSCFLGRQGVPIRLSSMKQAHIPSYAFPEAAVRVLSRAARYGEWLRQPQGREPELSGIDHDSAAQVLAEAGERRGGGEGWLSFSDLERLFGAYGIRFPETRFCRTPDEAAAAARELGFPVVVKLASDTVVHKSDVGGVRVDLRNEAEVAKAVTEIGKSLSARELAGAMSGVLVQPLVKDGVEVIVGGVRDALFGSLIMFGLGGIHVELLEDVVFRLHPLTDRDVHDMVREVKGFPLLAGYRGLPECDISALEDTVLRVSRLVDDFPEVLELDLNPVKVLPGQRGCLALDARVRVGPSSTHRG
jgi:acetyl coenzyme A synthetase (ADP forming)-like protein